MVAMPVGSVTALPMLTESVVSPKAIVWPGTPKSATSVTVAPAVADEGLAVRDMLVVPVDSEVVIQTAPPFLQLQFPALEMDNVVCARDGGLDMLPACMAIKV